MGPVCRIEPPKIDKELTTVNRMFHPDNKLKHLWDFVIAVTTVFAAIEIPAQFVLGYEENRLLHFADWFLTILFALDILVHFNTSLIQDRKVVSDRKIVTIFYLKGWFLVDFLAAIPFDILIGEWLLGFAGTSVALKSLRLIRLLRLARLIKIFHKWQNLNIINPSILRLILFIFWIFLVAHWMACGWLLLDGVGGDMLAADRYVRSLYWTVTTLTTVGYGDITPQTRIQTIYTMFVMILGVGIYGYVIGNISSLIANMDVAKANYRERLDRVNAFLKYRDIPPALSERIISYYAYLWDSRLGYDESTVMDDLPDALKTEVSLFLNRDIIEKVPLFRGASEELIRDIVKELHPLVATPGDFIFRKGDIGTCMYFISRGSVDVRSEDGSVLATLADGSFFGEIALVMSLPRTADIVARDYCDLYFLEKATFDRILGHYPDFSRSMHDMAVQRFGDTHASQNPNGEGAGEPESPGEET